MSENVKLSKKGGSISKLSKIVQDIFDKFVDLSER